MNLSTKIWIDGSIRDLSDVSVNVLSHGLHYGTSAFEGIRCYQAGNKPAVFRLNEHINRFFYSAERIGAKPDFTKAEIKDAICRIVTANNLNDCYIRPILYYGQGGLALIPASSSVHIAIACWPWVLKPGAEKGITTKISSFIRPHPDSVAIDAKVGGYYVNSMMAAKEAKDEGFDEAILLDYRGFIAEGPGENIFIVKDGIIKTPAKGSILPGITRDSIMELAGNAGIKVVEGDISAEDLKNADEAFFTGTAVEIWPILKVNDLAVGKGRIGNITKQLAEEYKKTVRGEIKKYSKWLTFISR